jgi:phosphoribosyl 1,2-cyclic phosphodiesterase
VKFWGVRGSLPTPQRENLQYGGNTCCLEVRCAVQPPLIFDAGTGVWDLGRCLGREFAAERAANLFLTHFHWDHIQGLPFFGPLYQQDIKVTFHSALAPARLERVLQAQMRSPYFPVPWKAVPAGLRYQQVGRAGVRLGDLTVRSFPLRHPGGAVGYRIETPESCIVFATDHEYGDDRHDAVVREYARGASVLIFDTQYTPEEYAQRKGWGHSTWRAGTELARAADVGQLVLFHHDPTRSDEALERLVVRAAAQFPNTIGAREGQTIRL